jgi:hypothetical protein
MANEIKIHLGTEYNDSGEKKARQSLSRLRSDVKATSAATAQMGKATAAANSAIAQSAVSAETAMSAAKGGMEGMSKFVAAIVPGFKKMGAQGVAAVGAVGAAVMSWLGFFKELLVLLNKGAFDVDTRAMLSGLNEAKKEAQAFKEEMAEARKIAAEQSKTLNDEAAAMKRIVDAQIELNKQKDLSLAKTDAERKAIEARYRTEQGAANDAHAAAGFDRRRKDIQAEINRLYREIDDAKRRKADFEKKERELTKKTIESYDDTTGVYEFFANMGGDSKARRKFDALFNASVVARNSAEEQDDIIDAKKKELEKVRQNWKLLKEEEKAYEIAAAARRLDEENDVAQERERQEEQAAAKRAESTRKEADARKKENDARLAAEKAIHELKMKQQAEAHKIAMDNLRKEQSASQAAEQAKGAIVAAAESEFDKTFGWYRNKGQAEAAIAEERDYADDLKQLHKDASRYGGKWRIEELSRLMAAGDTAGYQSTIEGWRKSRSFTPEIEAMVRASAAERTKTTAEAELRKIEANTANLDKKLDELLAMKG